MKDGFDSWRARIQGYVQMGALLVIANVRLWFRRHAK